MARTRAVSTPLAAVALAGAWLLLPIGWAGAWDPIEPDRAELGRRLAVALFGAGELARTGEAASLPTTGDLGMGELPFTSMALSFRVFGVADWAGRLPLALWGLAGALSVYALMARLVAPKAGFYALAALLALPLFALQARTMLGDIVAMSAFAMAISGLSLAVFASSRRDRLLALAWGTLGLAAGFFSRGALFGLAAPLLAWGLAAWLARRWSGAPARLGVVGAGAVIAGLGCVIWFALVVSHARSSLGDGAPAPLLRAAGMTLSASPAADATFDRLVRQLGHGLFPLGGVVLVSLGSLLSRPCRGEVTAAAFVRLLLLLASALSFGAASLVVPWAGALPFFGVAALACAVGLLAHDCDSDRELPVAALVAVLATLIVYVDLGREPARMLAAFGVDAPFPVTFGDATKRALVGPLFSVCACGGLSLLLAPDPRPLPVAESGARLVSWARQLVADIRARGSDLYEAFQGNLVFSFVVLEAGLVGLAGMIVVGGRAGWARVEKLPPAVVSWGTIAWWAVPLLLVTLPLAWVVVRDTFRAALRLTRLSRGAALMISAVCASAWLSFGYYPALADQLSPKGVLQVFVAQAGPSDELALLGTSPLAGAMYGRTHATSFDDVVEAHNWLDRSQSARRFLVLKARDLPKLNSLYRRKHASNVPVLDARSSQNVLVSNELGALPSQNPFDPFVLSSRPLLAKPVSARLGDSLEVLGWEAHDKGRALPYVRPQKPFTLRLCFLVEQRIKGAWDVFVHIDGNDKHQTVDHPPLAGRYPMHLWQPGDVICDETEVRLEPNLTPGEYWLFFGFFQGKKRMPVTDGGERDDRVIGGKLIVK